MTEDEIHKLSHEANYIELQAQMIVVKDEKTLKEATEFLGKVAKAKKQLEERRQFFVKPLNEQIRKINEFFKVRIMTLENAENIVKNEILKYREEVEKARKQQEELLKKQYEKELKKAQKKGLPLPPPMPQITLQQQEKTVETDSAQVTARLVWDFEIVDESKIPREYLMVNEKAIRAAIKAGVRDIPGVRIFQKEELAVKTK
jgi:hypothetical protein